MSSSGSSISKKSSLYVSLVGPPLPTIFYSGPSLNLETGRRKQGENDFLQLLLRPSRFARSERTGGLTARRSRRLMKDWFGVRGCVSSIMIAFGTVLIVTRLSSHLSTYSKMLRNQVEATWASGYIVRERIPGGGALSGQPTYVRCSRGNPGSAFYFVFWFLPPSPSVPRKHEI